MLLANNHHLKGAVQGCGRIGCVVSFIPHANLTSTCYYIYFLFLFFADLLMSTLRSKLVFACDKDFLSFKCPNNTVITIENANYGRQVPNKHMCPYRWSTVGSYQVKQFHEDTNCKAINSRQVRI